MSVKTEKKICFPIVKLLTRPPSFTVSLNRRARLNFCQVIGVHKCFVSKSTSPNCVILRRYIKGLYIFLEMLRDITT